MIAQDLGIVLRVLPYSRTSQIAVWLTRGQGRIATLAKGAYRPRYPDRGECDLFYTCELLYYPRETPRLNILKECCALERRPAFRLQPAACAGASYLCDLTARLCPPAAPHPELFDLLGAALDALAASRAPASLLFWFELRLLTLMGIAPLLGACPLCAAPVLDRRQPARFSPAAGGLLCARCAAGPESGAGHHTLTPDVLAVLQDWQKAPSPQIALRTRPSRGQLAALRAALGDFLGYHLDLMPPSRDIALTCIGLPTPPVKR